MVLPRTGRRPPRAPWSRGADRPRRRDRAVRPARRSQILDPSSPASTPGGAGRLDRQERLMPAPLGVTGSTGHLGGRVARLLAAARQRAAAPGPTPAKAPVLPRATVAQASYADGDAVRRALEGLATVLMVSAGDRAPGRRAPGVVGRRRARACGTGSTSPSTEPRPTPPSLARHHHLTEQQHRAVGDGVDALRDNLYADFPDDGGDDGVIRGPADDGRVAAVAQDDVGSAVTVVPRGRPPTRAGPTASPAPRRSHRLGRGHDEPGARPSLRVRPRDRRGGLRLARGGTARPAGASTPG